MMTSAPERQERDRCDWRRDLERGQKYEDFVYYILQKYRGLTTARFQSAEWQSLLGENTAGIEIKLNERYDETGNLWIEFYRKSTSNQQEYTPSSLLRDQATWLFVTGTYRRVFAYSAQRLRSWEKPSLLIENKTCTSKGVLLRGEDCTTYAEFVIEIPSHDIPDYVT